MKGRGASTGSLPWIARRSSGTSLKSAHGGHLDPDQGGGLVSEREAGAGPTVLLRERGGGAPQAFLNDVLCPIFDGSHGPKPGNQESPENFSVNLGSWFLGPVLIINTARIWVTSGFGS